MKRDINLLPKKKSGSSSSTKGIAIAMSVFLLYILVFGIAIKIPTDLVNAARDINTSLDSTIAGLQPQVDEYNALVDEINKLQAEINSQQEIEFSTRTFYSALQIIEKTCPTGVMIFNFKNTNETIELNCKAESDEQVAQFMFELDRSGEFASIQIDGTQPSTVTLYDDDGNSFEGNAREFNLVLVYGQPKAEAESAESGGGQ